MEHLFHYIHLMIFKYISRVRFHFNFSILYYISFFFYVPETYKGRRHYSPIIFGFVFLGLFIILLKNLGLFIILVKIWAFSSFSFSDQFWIFSWQDFCVCLSTHVQDFCVCLSTHVQEFCVCLSTHV